MLLAYVIFLSTLFLVSIYLKLSFSFLFSTGGLVLAILTLLNLFRKVIK